MATATVRVVPVEWNTQACKSTCERLRQDQSLHVEIGKIQQSGLVKSLHLAGQRAESGTSDEKVDSWMRQVTRNGRSKCCRIAEALHRAYRVSRYRPFRTRERNSPSTRERGMQLHLRDSASQEAQPRWLTEFDVEAGALRAALVETAGFPVGFQEESHTKAPKPFAAPRLVPIGGGAGLWACGASTFLAPSWNSVARPPGECATEVVSRSEKGRSIDVTVIVASALLPGRSEAYGKHVHKSVVMQEISTDGSPGRDLLSCQIVGDGA
ncbi:hypothetical protein M409DRAFT_50388 [Zasmidium cellare ATCC 36951]|uniref:Uncharacterized protein n=1 Tax=Zasmidium cellare ATCC 36951 TaxID=1080233 RepID=A0A6A6D0Q2_ZASCE|nr:uncharacterized protein M409DRAFT_50388 [Zasmidium cellare ATCC 36951]KAF2171732.1 hypothetical protein M409DRAFT_50388 [Zasmidium cellare ATCC 36951]